MGHTRRVIAGVLAVACATLAAQQATQPQSSSSGVYTAAQASAGEKIYFDKCAGCHGADLAGIERAPALTGSAFVDAWQGSDLRRLRDRIDTMPPTAPKSVSDADAAALMAFLLRASEMPSGTAPLPVAVRLRVPAWVPVHRRAEEEAERPPQVRRTNGRRTAATSPAIATLRRIRSPRTTSIACRSHGA